MKYRVVGAALAALGSFGSAAYADELPAIKVTSANAVPACATPGRLMAFAKSRNARIATQFDGTATEYMRHGEALKVRWDYAFFQMLVETANLSFVGDVKPSQHNFAGLGATGGGEPGEKFPSVSVGVKAHLQHVLMYAGETIAQPVAERTRKVQEWGVLTSWQKGIRGPMTFAHLTRKWSPKDRGYARDIASVAEAFYSRFCKSTDPNPELVALARGEGVAIDTGAAVKRDASDANAVKAKKASETAIADARTTSGPQRLGLGAGSIGATIPQDQKASQQATTAGAEPPASYTVLNADKQAEAAGVAAEQTGKAEAASDSTKPAETKVATAATTAAAAKAGCHVFQASYGGQKAVIIKADGDGAIHYTVLDVNEGREQREVAAYIAAYAKNGTQLGEFQSSGKALSKAFELCPES